MGTIFNFLILEVQRIIINNIWYHSFVCNLIFEPFNYYDRYCRKPFAVTCSILHLTSWDNNKSARFSIYKLCWMVYIFYFTFSFRDLKGHFQYRKMKKTIFRLYKYVNFMAWSCDKSINFCRHIHISSF